MTASVRSPLGEVVDRLDGMADYLTCQTGLPGESGWVPLGDMDETVIGAWYQKSIARLGDRSAAALDIGGELGQAAVIAWMVPVIASRRLPLLDLGQVAIRWDHDGFLNGVAWVDTSVSVLSDDPAVGLPGTVRLGEWEAMLDMAAERLTMIEPLFGMLRRVARVGWPGLWGSLGDLAAGYALWTARTLDTDRHRAWDDAQQIIDRIASRQSHLRARPSPFPVVYSRGEELFQVRGTCCLWYRSGGDADPDGDGYCTTCPLRTDDSRTDRLRRYLEDEAVTT